MIFLLRGVLPVLSFFVSYFSLLFAPPLVATRGGPPEGYYLRILGELFSFPHFSLFLSSVERYVAIPALFFFWSLEPARSQFSDSFPFFYSAPICAQESILSLSRVGEDVLG